MSRLSRNLLLGTSSFLILVLALVFWNSRRPPQVARLLPEADAIVYANVKPARLATHFDRSAPPRSAGFQAFVDATGVVPERDLDEVAFALTRRANPQGPNGPVAYTEVFRGHFDPARVSDYLARNAGRQEQYAGHVIFSLAAGDTGSTEPREVRVVVLGRDLLAASNAATAEQIHAVIDHQRNGLFSASSPSLLTERFREVPTLSAAWGLGSLGLPFAEAGHVTLLGMELPLPAEQPMVASLRYLGVLRLRVAAVAPTPELAMQQTGALTGLLGLFRTLNGAGSSISPQLAAAVQSITVAQSGTETVISADLPVELLRQTGAMQSR